MADTGLGQMQYLCRTGHAALGIDAVKHHQQIQIGSVNMHADSRLSDTCDLSIDDHANY